MTDETFAAMMDKLQIAYNKNLSPETWEIYNEMMADIPDELGLRAAMKCMAENKFMPTIAELRHAAAEIGTAGILPAEVAWEEVAKQIRYVGNYGSPKFSQPLIAKVVEMMGWRNLCFSEQPAIDRAQFIKYYNTYRERKVQDLVIPQAVKELGERLSMQKTKAKLIWSKDRDKSGKYKHKAV